ncbi:hypothetical protein Poly24_08750 [Rosistilla carotiformis]|uniref:Uncharacterized protein n=1 Tax=Rosistilla carotiformis TaxID=2528017 RepID=A0A518JNR8_9BACT|nr:hypothetical protein Poly24_08750 [Rosistilla carotiformis]
MIETIRDIAFVILCLIYVLTPREPELAWRRNLNRKHPSENRL